MDSKRAAVDIFLAGVESVKPDHLIRTFVSFEKNILKIKDLSYDLDHIKNLYVIGAGKASALMAQEVENILGNRITEGHIITKYHHSISLKYITATEAAHPVPDMNGIKGTEEILSIAHKAQEEDLVICLISGGGSALMTDLPESCTLEDLKTLNDVLLKSGASINEMNCIRKHLSKIKGGWLSKTVWPASIVSLILSDVIGDPLDVIASGPTSPDPTTFTDALMILKKYEISQKVPRQILELLRNGSRNALEETPKQDSEIFNRTRNLIIGNNSLALEASKEMAESLNYEAQIITSTLEGEVNDIAIYLTGLAKSIKELDLKNKVCLLLGGEPTIKISSNGKGGRNQHLALLTSKMLKDLPGITILSAGTDGTDGPTDAAGAIVDSKTSAKAGDSVIEEYLQNCDSYNFFKKYEGLIITGPTQTNVMDVVVVLIDE